MSKDGPELQETEFFIPQHTVVERVGTEGAQYGGPYLDDVQRVEAEVQRAAVEDRKADPENASSIAGTPLLTARQINGDGLVNGAVPDATLDVVVGSPEVDDDGNPTGNKDYLKGTSKKQDNQAQRPAKASSEDVKATEETREHAAKKAVASAKISK